jgi:hypothetical protein
MIERRTHGVDNGRGLLAGRSRRIRIASFGLVILLLAQYILGITYNLYGTAPTSTKKLTFFSNPLRGARVVVRTLLVLAPCLVVVSIRAKERPVFIASTVGLLSIMAAWANGSSFIGTGARGNSMAMAALAALAAVAILSYVTIPGTLGVTEAG